MNVGFMDDMTDAQRHKIQQQLTDKYEKRQNLFEEPDAVVEQYVRMIWEHIIKEKRLDITAPEKASRMINADTIKHSHVREVGAEWMCYQTWEKLGIGELLAAEGWEEEQIQFAATQVISRAVYPASELKTARWIKENSAVGELTGYDIQYITKDKLYQSALCLYEAKDAIEKHLSKRTGELFDLTDKIILLT